MRKFELGKTVMTRGIAEALQDGELSLPKVLNAIERHSKGDWGDTYEEDKELNEIAVKEGGRVFSAYVIDDMRIYIITEADRSYTAVMFPDEY